MTHREREGGREERERAPVREREEKSAGEREIFRPPAEFKQTTSKRKVYLHIRISRGARPFAIGRIWYSGLAVRITLVKVSPVLASFTVCSAVQDPTRMGCVSCEACN